MDVNAVRVLIVASDPLARAGLAAMLANRPECAVTGQVSGDADFFKEMEVYRPDVVLWDLGWDPTTMLDRLIDLREIGLPAVALLPDASHATDVWAANARGLLLRDAEVSSLIAALLAASQGLIAIDPALAQSLMPTAQTNPAALVESLTPRELEVLQLLAEGLPNKSIARQLDISEHTVKFHVNAIMNKLSAQSRTEAVVRATQLGLILL